MYLYQETKFSALEPRYFVSAPPLFIKIGTICTIIIFSIRFVNQNSFLLSFLGNKEDNID
jgi:hypothetical protein